HLATRLRCWCWRRRDVANRTHRHFYWGRRCRWWRWRLLLGDLFGVVDFLFDTRRCRQRGQQLSWLDGVGEGPEQTKGPESSLEELQAFPVDRENPQHVRAAASHLAQQLETRAVLQALTGDDDVKIIRAHQVEAVRLGGHRVDGEILPEQLCDSCQKS